MLVKTGIDYSCESSLHIGRATEIPEIHTFQLTPGLNISVSWAQFQVRGERDNSQ
jgi:hypothetical protein